MILAIEPASALLVWTDRGRLNRHLIREYADVSLDRQIERKRAALRKLASDRCEGRLELHGLFQRKAQEICPVQLGETVEYEFGKYGRVDRIDFDIDPALELEPLAEIRWVVWGHKINENHQLSKRLFSPIDPLTHSIQKGRLPPQPIAVSILSGRSIVFDLATRKRVR